MKPPAVGGVIALAVVLVDQIVKAGVLAYFAGSDVESDAAHAVPRSDAALEPRHFVQPVRPRFCRGADRAAWRLTLAVTGLLALWLFRSRSALPAVGLGLIIGGALGNAIDRVAHGAVVDYLDLHAFGRHFFVFNVADAAINIGVALLILDLLLAPRRAERVKVTGARLMARLAQAGDWLGAAD